MTRADPLTALVDDLRERVGDSLRTVGTYDADGYDVRYMRDDVEALYTEEELEAVRRELVLQDVEMAYLGDLFEGGDLSCAVHSFDDLVTFHFVDEEFAGLFVTVDADTTLELKAFVDRCGRALEKL